VTATTGPYRGQQAITPAVAEEAAYQPEDGRLKFVRHPGARAEAESTELRQTVSDVYVFSSGERKPGIESPDVVKGSPVHQCVGGDEVLRSAMCSPEHRLKRPL
jgi:hypothetical protein